MMTEEQALAECMPLVRYWAWRYRKWGVPLEDLEQEGAIGVVLGFRKWQPEGGRSLKAFVAVQIKAAIRDAVGARARSDRPRYVAYNDDLEKENGPSPEAAAARAEEDKIVRQHVERLPEPMRGILRMRLDDMLPGEIADMLGVTRERIHQIDRAAKALIREAWDHG